MSDQDPEQNSPEDHVALRRYFTPRKAVKKKPPLASLTPEERDARLKKIIMSGLGKAWMFWPPRNEVKRRCAIVFNNESGWFRCELCKREVQKIDVDHIIPCIKPSDGFTSWDDFINSRFVLADKLQGICTTCHKQKTKEENRQRREMKRVRKLRQTTTD